MKTALATGTALFVAGVLIGLAQLWFEPWSDATFTKIEMTLGALLAIVVVVWFAVREARDTKATRSGDEL